MKTYAKTRILPVLLLGLIPISNSLSQADEQETITRSADILRSLKAPPKSDAPLTRSIFQKPATEKPETRKGFTRSVNNVDTRSLSIVSVSVSPSANISLQSIRFKVNSTEPFDANSREQLRELSAALKVLTDDGGSFLIEGHTCPKGSSDHNDKLSVERADYVRRYLIENGISPSTLKAMGCGENEASAANVEPTADESILRPYRKVMVHRLAD